MKEIWKDIKGFESEYKISNMGRIISKERKVSGKNNSIRTIFEKEITPTFNGKGYLVVALYKDGKRYFKKMHRLVAEAFIPNPDNKPEVNHINGDKTKNIWTNLEWVTTKENCIHRQNNGLGNIEAATVAKYKPIAKIDMKTNKIIKKYKCVKDASIEMNCKIDAIARVARGERKSYKGYKWKYLSKV